MTAPTVQTTTGAAEATVSTSHTLNLPSGITAGDLLVIICANNSTGSGDLDFNAAGWSSLALDGAGGSSMQLLLAYKTATGSEGSTLAMTTTNSIRICYEAYRISGWSGTPEKGTAASGTSTSPDPPSASPSWGSADNLFLAAMASQGPRSATAYPTNYTNGLTTNQTGSNAVGIGTAQRQLTASSDDPAAFSIATSAAWRAQTYVIKPASAAAGYARLERHTRGIERGIHSGLA